MRVGKLSNKNSHEEKADGRHKAYDRFKRSGTS
jgi:hypothetical protein